MKEGLGVVLGHTSIEIGGDDLGLCVEVFTEDNAVGQRLAKFMLKECKLFRELRFEGLLYLRGALIQPVLRDVRVWPSRAKADPLTTHGTRV